MSVLAALAKSLNLQASVQERSEDVLRRLNKASQVGALGPKVMKCRELVAVELACRELREPFDRKKMLGFLKLVSRDYQECLKLVCSALNIKQTSGEILDRLAVLCGGDQTNLVRTLALSTLAECKRKASKCSYIRASDYDAPKYLLAAFTLAAKTKRVTLDKKKALEVTGVTDAAMRDAIAYLKQGEGGSAGDKGIMRADKENVGNGAKAGGRGAAVLAALSSSSSSPSGAVGSGAGGGVGLSNRAAIGLTRRNLSRRAGMKRPLDTVAASASQTSKRTVQQVMTAEPPTDDALSAMDALVAAERDKTAPSVMGSGSGALALIGLGLPPVVPTAPAAVVTTMNQRETAALANKQASRAKYMDYRAKVLEKRKLQQQHHHEEEQEIRAGIVE